MKNLLLIASFSFLVLSCNKSEKVIEKDVQPSKVAPTFKTAYVDTDKMMKDYQEAKDLETRFKDKQSKLEKDLKAKAEKFKADVMNFQKSAQANGQAWAQQNGAMLQKREQELQYEQQEKMQKIQMESNVQMDSLVSKVKRIIKQYGKEKGYSYIYGTGTSATVLYAEDQYDITKQMTELLNEKYKSGESESETPAKK